MRQSTQILCCAVLAAGALAGCRGKKSGDPPVHLIGDMDWQPHKLPQSESPIFGDGRSNRPIEQHTVARGKLKEDVAFFQGKEASGKFVQRIPFDVTSGVVARGEDRFHIFCTPCHDNTGGGEGLVVQRGFVKPPALYADHARGLSDGELFNVISHGQGNMPGYGSQIREEDRWAIVAFIRVLGQSQAAKVDDVPFSDRAKIEAQESEPK